MLHEVVVSM
jgi:hypothetical protein